MIFVCFSLVLRNNAIFSTLLHHLLGMFFNREFARSRINNSKVTCILQFGGFLQMSPKITSLRQRGCVKFFLPAMDKVMNKGTLAEQSGRGVGFSEAGHCHAMQSHFSCVQLYDSMDCRARLLCPRDAPGKNTGVGCHFLLQR